MDQYIGQVPEEVDALAAEFEAKAGDLESIQAALSAQFTHTTWTGPDRERFQGDWDSQLGTAFKQVAEMLRNGARAASGNAQEQRDASA